MSRCAQQRRVFFVEEPVFEAGIVPHGVMERAAGVQIVVPHLPSGLDSGGIDAAMRQLIDQLIGTMAIRDYVLWFYTPMALGFADHLKPAAVVYDCMDELAAFKGAPAVLKFREAELMRRASLVLTGGQSLYEAKRHQHPNIHAFPSSVDAAHFAQARAVTEDPADQASIPHPRLGFFGVLDERLDIPLLDAAAARRPDWQWVMVGPIVKIDPASLPQRPNIHYLGPKSYAQLPHYIAGWDVALLLFARNEATRYISPTKTPEYLAAGKPVVSTSIQDVVRPYGQRGLVRIADAVEPFLDACVAAMSEDPIGRRTQADAFLTHMSWDGTWRRIQLLMEDAIRESGGSVRLVAGGGATAG
jgi:UDP-galactopyranose mutase